MPMSNHAPWSKMHNRIEAHGGWQPQQGQVFSHGHNMLNSLAGDWPWFKVMALNATGKEISLALAKWLEALFSCISWPDSRIWCNQMASFGGTVKAPAVVSVAAGMIASNSRFYGTAPLQMVCEFIQLARSELVTHSVEEFIQQHVIKSSGKYYMPGWARPLSRGDERVPTMYHISYEELNFEIGEHMQASMTLDTQLSQQLNESINIGGFLCAFLLDQGFTKVEVTRLCTLITNGGMHACYAEAADSPPLSYLPLQCDDIEYTGRKRRSL